MYKVYKVLPGEELQSIADKLDMEMQVLCELNGLMEDTEVRAGESIVVPNYQANMFQTYRVKSGESLYEIGKRYDVSANDLALLNGIDVEDYIYPNQELMIPRKGVTIYLTKEGDTLMDVARRFKTSPERLQMENQNIYLLPEQLLVFKEENFI